MMDWVRLKQSAKDLAQLKGASLRTDITLSEVSAHTSPHEGWVVLRGVVYNVSPYLPYHPGGKRIVEKLVGRDITEEFDKYHRWVNIEGLIGVCKVGYLKQER